MIKKIIYDRITRVHFTDVYRSDLPEQPNKNGGRPFGVDLSLDLDHDEFPTHLVLNLQIPSNFVTDKGERYTGDGWLRANFRAILEDFLFARSDDPFIFQHAPMLISLLREMADRIEVEISK